MSGEIQLAPTNPATIIGQDRRPRALAYNGPARTPLLPDVPTMIESGVSGMEMIPAGYGVFAPAKTSPPSSTSCTPRSNGTADRGVRDASPPNAGGWPSAGGVKAFVQASRVTGAGETPESKE
jgi:hypothetical protein